MVYNIITKGCRFDGVRYHFSEGTIRIQKLAFYRCLQPSIVTTRSGSLRAPLHCRKSCRYNKDAKLYGAGREYLVEFRGGRLQALNWAWDSRPIDQGGQRWFHLYPSEKIARDDPLHWTQASQNWNYMCAECHSTNLQKNYDPGSRAYATTWSEIDVSCEACHGSGSDHVRWANGELENANTDDTKGLVVQFDERKDVRWTIDPETGNASRNRAKTSNIEIEICGRCHARRSPMTWEYIHGNALLDHYVPRLLVEGAYHIDGQIDDEAYVFGSFTQSKMFRAGVACSDCRDPHSLTLRAPGNGVCLQCHTAEKYDRPTHHRHKAGKLGASCVECHMPAKTYMLVDPRHDHSIRIPRPDDSRRFGTSNACNRCHTDKDAVWAETQMKNWYGRIPVGYQQFAQALYSARHDKPDAAKLLAELIGDAGTPALARATALTEFAPFLGSETLKVVEIAITDDEALVRLAAVALLDRLPPDFRLAYAKTLLHDPARAVRAQTARALAGIPSDQVPDELKDPLNSGLVAYIEAQRANAERAEAQTNLGSLYGAMCDIDQAVAAFATALTLDPQYALAYINFAGFYRGRQQESNAERVLRKAIEHIPDNASVHHALGLALVRQNRMGEANEALQLAAELDADNPRYTYVYAVALNSAGDPNGAIAVLENALTSHPNNREILSGLAAFHRDPGDPGKAQFYAAKLQSLSAKAASPSQ